MLKKIIKPDTESEILALEALQAETDKFIQSIYDYVIILKAQGLLAALYNFRRDLEAHIKQLKTESCDHDFSGVGEKTAYRDTYISRCKKCGVIGGEYEQDYS